MSDRRTIDEFHKLFYQSWLTTWANTRWLGVAAEKPPSDFWVYQEILHEVRPELIIETGTRFGGTARFLASVCDLLDHGRVITIDIEDLASSDTVRPPHPRITYLTGSSTSSEIIDQIRKEAGSSDGVLVILDSDHSMTHVTDELRLYAPIVTTGSYLIVEDTQVNGHPIIPEHGPGPMEAVEVFLRESPEFVPDVAREKFLVTFNPSGFLKRVGAESAESRALLAEQRARGDRDELQAAREQMAGLEARISALEEEKAGLQGALSSLEQSLSWKATAPLRGAKRRVKGS